MKVEEDDGTTWKHETPDYMDCDVWNTKSNGKVKDTWTASHRNWNASHSSWKDGDRKWKDGDSAWKDGDSKWKAGSGQWKDSNNQWASKDKSDDWGYKKSYAKDSYDDCDSQPYKSSHSYSKSSHSYSTQAQTIVHDHIVMLIYVYTVI